MLKNSRGKGISENRTRGIKIGYYVTVESYILISKKPADLKTLGQKVIAILFRFRRRNRCYLPQLTLFVYLALLKVPATFFENFVIRQRIVTKKEVLKSLIGIETLFFDGCFLSLMHPKSHDKEKMKLKTRITSIFFLHFWAKRQS